MARKLFERQAIRRRTGALAAGIAMVVYTDAAGTVLADVSTSSGGSAIPGSIVTSADIAGLGPAALRFYGPPDGADTLYIRVPADTSLGVQEIEASADDRLDILEGVGAVAANTIDPEASPYLADGTGAANSATALAAAISDAQSSGKALVSRPGRIYRVDSTLSVTATMVMDLRGSRIKKGAALNGYALSVTGADVTLRNVVVDGNRSGGALGSNILWQGLRGKAFDCTSSHSKLRGWFVDTANGQLDAVRCVATDNVSAVTGVGAGQGFTAGNSGLLRTFDCEANDNDYAGFFLTLTAADGCRIHGTANRNAHAGAHLQSDAGTMPYFYAEDNNNYGVLFAEHPADWMVGTIKARRTGAALAGFGLPSSDTGTGVECFGLSDSSFDVVDSRETGGYGLAIVHDPNTPAFTSTRNQFGTVIVFESNDPGITFNNGASHNRIGTALCWGTAMGVNFGEGDLAFDPVVHNTIGTLFVRSDYVGVRFDLANHNRIDRIIARNCGSIAPTTIAKGVVQFGGLNIPDLPVIGNSVGWLDSHDDAALASTRPQYLVHAASWAVANRVEGGIGLGFTLGQYLDENGTNRITLTDPVRHIQIATFESTETWTNTTNNATPGEYIQGSQGKKVVGGAPGTTTSVFDIGSNQNWSAVTNAEHFRLWVFMANLADAGGSATALRLRFVDPGGSAYFQMTWPASALANGINDLYWRKGDMVATLTPAWSSIRAVHLLLVGTAGTIAATADDLVVLA